MGRNGSIVVLGMHRSGTSAVTRGLQVFGCELGHSLLMSVPGVNDRGFFEDEDINQLNERLLASLGRSWHSLKPLCDAEFEKAELREIEDEAYLLLVRKFSELQLWGFKEPRTTILLPFWQRVFARMNATPAYLIAFRNPLSVAGSLKKRDAFPEGKSYLLWANYMLSALVYTQGTNRAFVDYDKLIDSPKEELKRLSDEFGLGVKLDEHKLGQYLDFLAPELRHNRYSDVDVDGCQLMPDVAKDLYRWLRSQVDLNAAGHDGRGNLNEILASASHLNQMLSIADQIDAKLVQCMQESERLKKESECIRMESERLSALLVEVYASRSWRITAPLRFMHKIFGEKISRRSDRDMEK